MGFSTSAVVVIFTASVMYMASMFYPLVDMSYNKVQEANKYSNELWNGKMNTKIEITRAYEDQLTVLNEGSTTLNSSNINIIVNGTLISSSLYIVNPPGVWSPETEIDIAIDAGENRRVKIITANGASDSALT